MDVPIRVLMVEDNPGDVHLMSLILKSWPRSQLTVLNQGDKAMRFIEGVDADRREAAPDLILLDLRLPGVDGFAILDRLRQSSRLQDVTVAVLSSYIAVSDRRRALASGATYCFKKPSNLDEVIALGKALEELYLRQTALKKPAVR